MQEQILSNVNKVKITAEVDDDGNLIAGVKFQAATSPQAIARLAHFVKQGGALSVAFQTPQLAFDLSFAEIKPIDARAEGPPAEEKKAKKPSRNGKGTKAEAAEAVPAEAPEEEAKEEVPA